MPFSRALAPTTVVTPDALTSALTGIGMNFAATPIEANIEDTLLLASEEGMDRADLRVLAALVAWFGVHGARVNADRLTLLVRTKQSERVRALWASLARWQAKDRRFERLLKLHRGARIELLSAGNAFQIKRHGEDGRFEGSALCVPANVLRDRPGDVLTPVELAHRHKAYRYRVIIGPSYRADMWAALDVDPTLSAAELARRTYGSFATAWHVRRDYALVSGRQNAKPPAG